MYLWEFGERLKRLRKERGLTQAELGSRVGLSKAVVSKYENAIGYPSYDVLIQLAAFFRVSTDYLLGVAAHDTVDLSRLTESQAQAVRRIVAEFEQANGN